MGARMTHETKSKNGHGSIFGRQFTVTPGSDGTYTVYLGRPEVRFSDAV